MKTTLLTFLSAFLLITQPVSTQAQIQLLSTDLAVIGDQVVRYNDTIPTYAPGGSGANQTWDFSAAIIDETLTTSVQSVASTPYASDFGSSNLAMTNGTGSYLYFNQNTSLLSTTGAAGDLLETGEIIVAPFSDPLKLHQFPRTYGSFFNDTYAFQAEADGAAFGVYRIRLTHNGHVYDTTDAHGTLITPTGTYEALRVKSTDYTTDVIEVKLSAFFPWTPFTTLQDTSVSYSWHSKQEKLAIAEFAFDSIGNPARFTYSSIPPVATVGIEDRQAKGELKVYPSPATDLIWIVGSGPIDAGTMVQIFGLDGKLVLNEQLIENSLAIGSLRSGLYFLRLLHSNKELGAPTKFMVE